MTDPKDHNHLAGPHGPGCSCPDNMPAVAQVVEVKGGPADGLQVAVVDTRDCALALMVDHEGNLNVQTQLDPVETFKLLSQITKAAQMKAREWLAAQQ